MSLTHFEYDRFHTRREAELELEDYFACGIIDTSDQARIECHTAYNHATGKDCTFYCIMLRDRM